MTGPQLTHLFDAAGSGDAAAQRELYDLAYTELKRIARGALRRSGAALTVNPGVSRNRRMAFFCWP